MVFSIEEIKEKSIPIAVKHGLNSLGIFGSYAKNTASNDSDLDFIMDDGDVNTLLKYMALVNDLEEIFNCHVDVISSCSNNKTFLNKIKKDVIIIYER